MAVNRPNIVLITADQWRGDCVGYRSHRHPVMTPHINQLAAEGIDFTHAYTDCPVCMPQRATILSGKTGASLGVLSNFNCRTPVEDEYTLPRLLFREGGYQTNAIGKMHFSPARARLGFEHVTLHPNDYVIWLEDMGYGGMYRGHGLGGNEVYPATSAVPERFSHTHWIVDQSVRFLSERDPENPFFLWMVFEAPHSPFDPPEPYDRMYDNFTIPAPIMGEWQKTECPLSVTEKTIRYKFNDLNGEMLEESRRKYYGQITHIDYQLGRFLGELKSLKLYDNTVIIFTSDHGEHLGDFGLFGKTTFLSGSADVPLIIKPAENADFKGLGKQCSTPVLTADIYTTILGFAGIESDPGDGKSLADTVAGKNDNRTIFGEFGENGFGTAFAVHGNYKYIYYVKGGKELLFDVDSDPDNIYNLAHDPQFCGIKENLRAALIEFLVKRNRPMIKDNNLAITEPKSNPDKNRTANPFALRGPMHYGQGY